MPYVSPLELKKKELGTRFITKKETALFLRVSESTVDSYRRKKILQAYKIGQNILFKKDEVENAIIAI